MPSTTWLSRGRGRSYPQPASAIRTTRIGGRRQRRVVNDGIDERADVVAMGNLVRHVSPRLARVLHPVLQRAHVFQPLAVLVESPRDDVAHERARRLALAAATQDFANLGKREPQALCRAHEPHALDIKRDELPIAVRRLARGPDEPRASVEAHDVIRDAGAAGESHHREESFGGNARGTTAHDL